MKWGVAGHIIKTQLRLVGADIPQGQVHRRKQETHNLVCLGIKLTAVQIGFHRKEVKKAALATGEIGYQVVV